MGPIQIVPSAELHDLLTNPVHLGPSSEVGMLAYHGGKVIKNGAARVFNLYIGAVTVDRVDFDAFSKSIVEEGYYVSPDGLDTSSGKFIGSKVMSVQMGSVVNDSALSQFVDNMVSTGELPPQDGSTLYSIMLPPGITVILQGSSSCNSFCGYHSRTSKGNYYAVMIDPSCIGCHGSFTPAEGRTMVYAHEYAEWRSDPDLNAWYNDATGMENADECAWNKVLWKGWTVQPFAVNGRGCIIGTPTSTPPPPPTTQGPEFHMLVAGSRGTVAIEPVKLPYVGIVRSIQAAFIYPDKTKQTFSVGLGTPRTPVGKFLAWLGGKL